MSKVVRDDTRDAPVTSDPAALDAAHRSTLPNPLAQLPEIIAIAVIVAASLAAFVPLNPSFPSAALDPSWAFALNVAVAKGLVFGRDIVFTFGPYASAYTTQFYPATDALALWSTGLCGLAFALGLIALSRGAGRAAAAVLAIFAVLVPRDTLFLALPLEFVLLVCRSLLAPGDTYRIEFHRPVRVTVGVLTLALSLITLVKGTFVLPALAAIVLGVGLMLARGYRAPATACAVLFVLAVPIFWVLANQPLDALPGFFRAQVPIVSGYTEAMSIPGVGGHPILFALCALAVGLIYARFIGGAGLAGTFMWVGVALLLFVSFKAGFVRQDWHTLIAAGMLVIVAWMLALGTSRGGAVVGVAIALIAWSIMRRDETGLGPLTVPSAMRDAYGGAARMLLARLTAPDRLIDAYAESLATIRAAQLFPEIAGTVDAYSYDQAAILARNLRWSPRPVFQSYSAYSPQLAQLNADHLTGRAAPNIILFAVQPIDRRLPALEDGPSWPTLLTHYRLAGVRGDIAILERRASPTIRTPIGRTALAQGKYDLGTAIPVPAHAPAVWARIDVALTPLGKLMTAFDKPPPLNITYRFADGSQRQFRYIPGMGAAGFLASPLIENTTDFLALQFPAAATYFAGRRPRSIEISATSGAGSLWASRAVVTFSPLVIPSSPVNGLVFDRVAVVTAARPNFPRITDCALNILGHGGGDSPIPIGRFLRALAWVGEGDGGVHDSDLAALVVRARNGGVHAIEGRKIPRGDVGALVDLPPEPETTYAFAADLESLAPGAYTVGLEAMRDGYKVRCANELLVQVGRRPKNRGRKRLRHR